MTAALPVPLSARIDQQWIEALPQDLYVPPDAFAVLLERFEGPLDFLLYLVRKNGFDLLALPIAPIAEQYLAYIATLRHDQMELAGDYLVMAALLTDLKSRLLLPRPVQPTLEADPRVDLMQRLHTYARFKAVAQQLGGREVVGRDVFVPALTTPTPEPGDRPLPGASDEPKHDAQRLADALHALLSRPGPTVFALREEPVQLQERLDSIRGRLCSGLPTAFGALLLPEQGRLGVVVSLVAVLELLRLGEVTLGGDGWDAPLTLLAAPSSVAR